LLDEAQLEAGRMRLNPTPFAPRELTERVCGELNAQAEKRGLHLSAEVEPGLPQQLVGDQNRLEQILMNLVFNALKFTRQGNVRVRLYPTDGDRWAMQVSDTGPGIPPQAQARIFEPFWQMDNSLRGDQAGYGLGLSIVKQLTTLMGGQINLESEVGRGSTFTVLLPLQETTA
jgi:signal transduction histidine kinase